jgi:hypothetical protein
MSLISTLSCAPLICIAPTRSLHCLGPQSHLLLTPPLRQLLPQSQSLLLRSFFLIDSFFFSWSRFS